MKSKNKLIIALSSLIVIIIGIAVILIIATTGNGQKGKSKYIKKIEVAQKYVQEENWDDAIVAYREAIEIDDTDEDSYYTLAQIYMYSNRPDDAKDILLKGMDITRGKKLDELYNKYFKKTSKETDKEDEEKNAKEDENIALAADILKKISTYTLDKYIEQYGQAEYSESADGCEVKHKSLKNFIFTYFDSDSVVVIDEKSGRPKDNKMPGKITCTDLTELFEGVDGDVITKEIVESMELKNTSYEKGSSKHKYVLKFEAYNCLITIETDKNGDFKKDAWNEIVPKNVTNDEEEVFDISAVVISSSNGEAIEGAVISISNKSDSNGKEAYATSYSDENGEFTVELEEGEYIAEIEAEGYIIESFDFTVNEWGEIDVSQFIITEELAKGEIRIVLEWGDYPEDLDSYLIGENADGERVYVCYYDKIGDEAELDVDDTTGYGPETITIKDNGAGDYVYIVKDYDETGKLGESMATVKVYMPGKTAPKVFTVPEDIDSNIWNVFRIKNGSIIDVGVDNEE